MNFYIEPTPHHREHPLNYIQDGHALGEQEMQISVIQAKISNV